MTTITNRHQNSVLQGETRHHWEQNYTAASATAVISGVTGYRIVLTGVMMGSSGVSTVLVDASTGQAVLPLVNLDGTRPFNAAVEKGLAILPNGADLRVTTTGVAVQLMFSYVYVKQPA